MDILIVSSSEKFNSFMSKILTGGDFSLKDRVKSASLARRRLLERGYDVVIINTPVADEFGVELASDIAEKYNCGIILTLPSEIFDDVTEQVVDGGVLTIARPISAAAIMRGIRFLNGVQRKFKNVEKKALTLEEKMDEIRVVNKAKWLLIQNKMISEDEAHRLIGKQAMNSGISRRAAAEMIINKYEK